GLPVVGPQTCLSACLMQESFAIPVVHHRDLRQKKTAGTTLTHHQAVLSDLEFTNVVNALQRRKHRNLTLHLLQLSRCQRHTSGIADCSANSAFCNAPVERAGRMNVPDAATQVRSFVY